VSESEICFGHCHFIRRNFFFKSSRRVIVAEEKKGKCLKKWLRLDLRCLRCFSSLLWCLFWFRDTSLFPVGGDEDFESFQEKKEVERDLAIQSLVSGSIQNKDSF
jgi:hypothetical protein